jgi:hypothetical protein
MTHPMHRGFVLITVLVLLSLAALLLGDALNLGAQSSALAGRDVLRLRAFEGAEAGLALGVSELSEHVIPRTHRQLRRSDGTEVAAELLLDQVDSLPEGYSAGRVQVERYRVTSTATAARGTRLVLELGVSRLVPAGAP